RGFGRRRARKRVQTEETPRALRPVGRRRRSTIEEARHEPRLRDAEPCPPGGEIASAEGARRRLAQQLRWCRRPGEELVAVRGDDERPAGKDAHEGGGRAHGARS